MRSRSRNKRMCAVAAILNSLRLLLLAVVVLLNFVASQVVCSASVARETKKKQSTRLHSKCSHRRFAGWCTK